MKLVSSCLCPPASASGRMRSSPRLVRAGWAKSTARAILAWTARSRGPEASDEMGRAAMLPLRKTWKQPHIVYVWFVYYISSAHLNHVLHPLCHQRRAVFRPDFVRKERPDDANHDIFNYNASYGFGDSDRTGWSPIDDASKRRCLG
jgi:hypothetical protein